MAIEIRLLKDDESALANNFFNEIYRSHRSIEDFRWEFINGPKGKAIYVVAVDADERSFVKVVGIQCAIPLELTGADGKNILTAKSEDTLVHPGYRGQKIFERMYDLLFEECRRAGIKYIWGFTPAQKAFERLGFEIPFKTGQALLALKPLKAYSHLVKLNPQNRWKEKMKIGGLVGLSYFTGIRQSFLSSGQVNLEEIKTPVDKTGIINKFYAGSGLYFLRHDPAYLKWRLVEHPLGSSYRNFAGTISGQLSADIIVNARDTSGYIEQMLFSSESSMEDRLKFLKKSIDVLSRSGTAVIRALCFPTNTTMKEEIELLKKAGFTYLGRGNYFVWKSLDQANDVSVDKIFFSRLFTQGIT